MITPATPLESVTFAVLDVETTGLEPTRGDRVCEVAVLRGRAGARVDEWVTLINPGRAIGRGAQAVNGISPAMVQDAPPFLLVAADLLARLHDTVLVAHNAPFDLSFMRAELARAGLGAAPLPLLVVDTCALARACYQFPSNGLEALGRLLHLQAPPPAHRALADVQTTWNLLQWLLADLPAQGHPLNTLGDLLACQHNPGGRRPYYPNNSPAAPAHLVPPVLAGAIAAGHTLRTRYRANDGLVSERRITPRQVTVERRVLYVVAYCHLRNEERTFRLDRLEVLAIEDEGGAV